MSTNLNRRRQVFVVCVETNSHLEAQVVTNYVNMAICKFNKLSSRVSGVNYFESYYGAPVFSVKEIKFNPEKPDETDFIRKSVEVISKIRDFSREIFTNVVDRSL